MEDALLIVRDGADKWTVDHNLEGMALQCVAVDPQHSARIYVGTDDQGVWRSQDGGRMWGPAGSGIAWTDVTTIAVGGERAGRLDTVYVGTEPSAVFRSTEGGETWKELKTASPNFRWRPPGASRPGPEPPRTLDWNRPVGSILGSTRKAG